MLLRDRRGSMYAWIAALMLFVGIPLSSLSIDVARLMYVRTHLQTATDAACQAAADALDVPTFRESGTRQINPTLARSQASMVFSATLQDASAVQFSPGLAVSIAGAATAYCTGTATVAHFVPMTPSMNAIVRTVSEMSVRTLP